MFSVVFNGIGHRCRVGLAAFGELYVGVITNSIEGEFLMQIRTQAKGGIMHRWSVMNPMSSIYSTPDMGPVQSALQFLPTRYALSGRQPANCTVSPTMMINSSPISEQNRRAYLAHSQHNSPSTTIIPVDNDRHSRNANDNVNVLMGTVISSES